MFLTRKGQVSLLPKNADNTDPEFLTNISRGKLCYPPGDLLDSSLYCCTFYKARSEKKKCCDKIFLQAYNLIYEIADYEFESMGRVIKRFLNTFFKVFVKKESDLLTKKKTIEGKLVNQLDQVFSLSLSCNIILYMVWVF